MKKRKPSWLLVAGICLILLGVILAVALQVRTQLGESHSRQIAEKLCEILPERSAGVPGMYPEAGMPALQVQGADYVAVLEVPGYGITLPVAEGWDSGKLSDCPARFCGSAYDGSLVIGGSYGQFDFCGQIDLGAEVTVTDMTGAEFTYTVARVDRADHAEAQWLTEDAWDLTLFCQDIFAMQYIAVRCNQK